MNYYNRILIQDNVLKYVGENAIHRISERVLESVIDSYDISEDVCLENRQDAQQAAHIKLAENELIKRSKHLKKTKNIEDAKSLLAWLLPLLGAGGGVAIGTAVSSGDGSILNTALITAALSLIGMVFMLYVKFCATKKKVDETKSFHTWLGSMIDSVDKTLEQNPSPQNTKALLFLKSKLEKTRDAIKTENICSVSVKI